MLTNDPSIQIKTASAQTYWLDLTDYSDLQEFIEACNEKAGGVDWIVSEVEDIPAQYLDYRKWPLAAAFEFANWTEHDRGLAYIYSLEVGSATHRDDLLGEARQADRGIWQRQGDFARHEWESTGVLSKVPNQVVDCIDWDKVIKKLEESYVFMDCVRGYQVFSKG